MTTADPIQSILGGGRNGRRPARAKVETPMYVRVDAARKALYVREAALAGITLSEMVRRAMDAHVAEQRRERRRTAKTPDGD